MQKGRDEVTISGRVHTVGDDSRETESRGDPVDVNVITGTGDRAGPERQFVDLVEKHAEAFVVPAQGGNMGEKEMRYEDRLRPAHVRVGGHQRIASGFRTIEQ